MFKKNSNRKTLTKKIYENIGFSKTISENLIKDIFNIIISNLETSDKVKITSFGTFYKKRKKKRPGINPKTKESKIITERNVITFKAAKEFKKKINIDS